MRTFIVAILGLSVLSSNARAVANPDEPAAVVVFPYVAIDPATNKDVLIQLTNTSDQPIEARCFYENLTPQCSSSEGDASCMTDPITCSGLCIPRNTRIPLRVRLTPFQPLAWQAGSGLTQPPLTDPQSSATGVTNQFTNVPGLGAGPFIGTLRCIAVDDDPLHPSRNNVLLGLATIQQYSSSPTASADAAQYRAIGVKALDPGANHDEFLTFGGPDGEYESCPAAVSLNHFFDGAVVHAGDSTSTTTTTLVLASCAGTPPDTSSATRVQMLVRNEFDQRFSTSRALLGQFVSQLSHIDSRVSENSIFSVDVMGTLTGRSRLRGIDGGIHAIAIESHAGSDGDSVAHSDAVNAHAYAHVYAQDDEGGLPDQHCGSARSD